jgi:hypothetical protein
LLPAFAQQAPIIQFKSNADKKALPEGLTNFQAPVNPYLFTPCSLELISQFSQPLSSVFLSQRIIK